jgi:hypothetical protein
MGSRSPYFLSELLAETEVTYIGPLKPYNSGSALES